MKTVVFDPDLECFLHIFLIISPLDLFWQEMAQEWDVYASNKWNDALFSKPSFYIGWYFMA